MPKELWENNYSQCSLNHLLKESTASRAELCFCTTASAPSVTPPSLQERGSGSLTYLSWAGPKTFPVSINLHQAAVAILEHIQRLETHTSVTRKEASGSSQVSTQQDAEEL